MCYSCFEEVNSPSIFNSKTKEAANLVNIVYNEEGCVVGGYGHIVFDDWNIEDKDVDFCIEAAKKGKYEFINDNGRKACLDALLFFKKLTIEERYSALAIASGFIKQ